MRTLITLPLLLILPGLWHCAPLRGSLSRSATDRPILHTRTLCVNSGLRLVLQEGRDHTKDEEKTRSLWRDLRKTRKGGALHLALDSPLPFPRQNLVLRVTTRHLRHLVVRGDASVTLVRLSSLASVEASDKAEVVFVQQTSLRRLILRNEAKGSGQIATNTDTKVFLADASQLRLRGRVKSLRLQASERSEARLRRWRAGGADVIASGQSDLRLAVARELHYNLSQRAFLMVEGEPVVKAGSIRSERANYFRHRE